MTTRTKGGRGSSRSRTRLGIRHFDDRILLTDTHAWAYYRIPSVSYEFTTPDEREALATNITVALAAIRRCTSASCIRIAASATVMLVASASRSSGVVNS